MATHPAPNSERVDTSRYELVQGKLIERAVPGFTHSSLQERITQLIRLKVSADGKIVRSEFSLDKDENPGSDWLTPDALVSKNEGFRLKEANEHALPPVFLAVEVLSTGQSFMTMRWKADQYLNWGVEHVWFLDPESRAVLTFDSRDRGRAQLISEGIVSVPDELSLALSEIFK
jgi:Uma2 family endonuclease